MAGSHGPLVLGPMLRYIGETDATVWVETAERRRSSRSRPTAGQWRAPTFAVKGHHYALVVVDGLAPGDELPYAVRFGDVAGLAARGLAASRRPGSARSTGRDRRELLFGSCRTSVPHDRAGNASNGVDALRALALALADGDGGVARRRRLPR